jgi:hypothetical protein
MVTEKFSVFYVFEGSIFRIMWLDKTLFFFLSSSEQSLKVSIGLAQLCTEISIVAGNFWAFVQAFLSGMSMVFSYCIVSFLQVFLGNFLHEVVLKVLGISWLCMLTLLVWTRRWPTQSFLELGVEYWVISNYEGTNCQIKASIALY